MNPKWFKYAIILIFVLLLSCAKEEPKITIEEAAKEVVTLLQDEEYEVVHETWFDEEFQEAMSVEELAKAWKARTMDGEFIDMGPFHSESRTDTLATVEVTLEYTNLKFDVRMVFNESQRIVGFNLTEGVVNVELPDSVVEEEIIVGEGTEYELEGLLTLPKDVNEKLPAVVLVHGSGPSDRDETVFAYKPFRDLAWGLAEQGIAVVRYDKRTYTYPTELSQLGAKLTVFEETVEDAIRATELVKADSRIVEDHVFIVGHSLGGMLAPRIDIQGGDYAGLVSLAGTPRTLWEVAYDQYLAIIESEIIDEDKKEEQLNYVEEEYEKAKNLENMTDEEAQETTIFGMSGYYFKEMDQFAVPSLIEELEKPILILQGKDDFQVYYEKDYSLWKKLLSDYEQATFISYPGLNHSFIAYEGPDKGTPKEYETPGVVDEQVIEDIGEWILNNY